MHDPKTPRPHRPTVRRVLALLAPLTVVLLAAPTAAVAAANTPSGTVPGAQALATEHLFVGGTFN
jgi:hypothetical protein